MSNVPTVLEKEMNRRDFLRYVGSLFLAVVGITNLMRIMSGHGSNHRTHGYGSSSYGGNKKDV